MAALLGCLPSKPLEARKYGRNQLLSPRIPPEKRRRGREDSEPFVHRGLLSSSLPYQSSFADHYQVSWTITMEFNIEPDAGAQCRKCGACCAFSSDWPRFSLETERELDRIPRAFVDERRGRMRCDGNRCTALIGDVGVATACAVYAVRPDVCRTCSPGDGDCQAARTRFGL